jgi:hypothetical protein
MSGPDGVEERTADFEEDFERDLDLLDVETQLADEARDAELIALARRAIARNPTDYLVRLAIGSVINGVACGKLQ